MGTKSWTSPLSGRLQCYSQNWLFMRWWPVISTDHMIHLPLSTWSQTLTLSFLCYLAFIYWNICVKCWWVKKRRRKNTVIGLSVHRKDCFCREPIVFYRIVRKPPTRPHGIKWLPKASLCQSRNVRLVQYKIKKICGDWKVLFWIEFKKILKKSLQIKNCDKYWKDGFKVWLSE